MIRVATLLALLLLAQSIDSGRSRAIVSSPDVHVDRHVDAHVAPREDTPAASSPERPSRESSAPAPALGAGGPQSPPLPPAIQLYRDPLSRDRRY
jgi:hypothetical protein